MARNVQPGEVVTEPWRLTSTKFGARKVYYVVQYGRTHASVRVKTWSRSARAWSHSMTTWDADSLVLAPDDWPQTQAAKRALR